jgi:hypothetical protein
MKGILALIQKTESESMKIDVREITNFLRYTPPSMANKA